MGVQFANYQHATIAGVVAPLDVTITVTSSVGFPVPVPGSKWFYATLVDAASALSGVVPPLKREIVKVTAVAGTTWTVARGQDSTVAQAWAIGDAVELRLNAQALADLTVVGTYFNVTDYGVIGDGATDNTAAINAMLAAIPSGTIFWPPGVYFTNGGHTVPSNVSFIGSGRDSSFVYATHATNNIFTLSGTYNTIQSMQFSASVVRSAGSYLVASGNYTNIQDIAVWNAFRGITISGTSINVDKSFFYNGVAGTGAEIEINNGTADIALTSLVMDAPNGSQPLAGVLIIYTADVVLHDCNIIHHGSDLFFAPSAGLSIGSVYASQCFFDTAVNGLNVVTAAGAQVLRCIFESCWFSSHSNNGIVTSNPAGTISGIDFINCHMFLNTGSGAFISNASNIRFLGGEVAQNGNNGLVFGDAGATSWSVIGMKIGAVAGLTGNVGVGILINAAGIDNFVIQGNNLLGNTVGAISNASTGTNWSIAGNVGDTVNPLFQADRVRADMTTGALLFQTQVANALTFIATLPQGAGAASAISAFNTSDPANTAFVRLLCNATGAQLVSQKTGTGTLLPLQFTVAGVVGGQFDTNANLQVLKGEANAVVAAKTANYSILTTDRYVRGTVAAGSFAFTLPAANALGAGISQIIDIKRTDSSANTLTVQRAGADTIDGGTSITMNTLGALQFRSDGVSNWDIL